MAKVAAFGIVGGAIGSFAQSTEICLPARTDVRGHYEDGAVLWDIITLDTLGINYPFYVLDTWDVGRGFVNEYRVAGVNKLGYWPVPVP